MRRDPASWGEFWGYHLMALGIAFSVHVQAYDVAAFVAMIAIRYMLVSLKGPHA